MADTQWPRFVVFLQERANTSHQYVGSVHAPDAEMALLNARDVFVRRPNCVSLWVVPAEAILMKTAEELAHDLADAHTRESAGSAAENYRVFYKLEDKGTFIHDGDTAAGSAEAALWTACATATGRVAKAIWLFPTRAVVASTPDDVVTMFRPADDKVAFRDQSEFRVTATMRQVKSSRVAE